MRTLIILLFCCSVTATFCGCGSSSGSDGGKPDADTVDIPKTDDDIVRDKVYTWLRAINKNERSYSLDVYAPQVKFYHETYTAAQCADARAELLAKKPGYKQQIDGYIDISDLDDGRKKAFFTKSSRYNGEPHSYEAYLIFARQPDGDWRIVEEGDLTTDRNLEKRAQRKAAKVPSNAVYGDFDGDGAGEYVWISGAFDDDGYAIDRLVLKSDNNTFSGLSFNAPRGVALANLGKLDGGRCDYLGACPSGDSSWCSYYVYKWVSGSWREAVDSFTIWDGGEYTGPRVESAGHNYVTIHYNEMNGEDFSTHTARSRLLY